MVIVICVALIASYLMYGAWRQRRYPPGREKKPRLFVDDRYVRLFVFGGLILLVPELIVGITMPKQSSLKTFLLIPCYPGWILTQCMLGRSGGSYMNAGSLFAMLTIFLVNHVLTYALAGKLCGCIALAKRKAGGSSAEILGGPRIGPR